MSKTADLLGLERILFRYENKGKLVARNGTTFVCPLKGGQLLYLHTLYHLGDADRGAELARLLTFAPPTDYAAFMNRCNGATLFDNALAIYGIVPRLNRGLDIEDLQPISLADELRYAGIHGQWRIVGSATGFELLFPIEIRSDGQSRMRAPDGSTREFGSFQELMLSLAEFFEGFVGENGFKEPLGTEMDAALRGFCESSDRTSSQLVH